MTHPALDQLRALQYCDALPAQVGPVLRDWLMLEDSMTRRFERYCRQVSVQLVHEAFVGPDRLLTDEALWLEHASRYWLREIVLCGDGIPWLAGRTVVPETTLTGPELALQHLGDTPLGRYLFTASTLTRDFIQPGRSGVLWGRRSRFRLSGKPLLLTELFLPAAPLYQEEEKWSGV